MFRMQQRWKEKKKPCEYLYRVYRDELLHVSLLLIHNTEIWQGSQSQTYLHNWDQWEVCAWETTGMPSEFKNINHYKFHCCHLVTMKYGKGSRNQTSLQHLGLIRAMLHTCDATEKKTNHVHVSRVSLDMMNYMFQCCPVGNTKFWKRGSHNQTSLQHLGLMSNVQCLGATEENRNTNYVHGPRFYSDMMIICFNAAQLVILK